MPQAINQDCEAYSGPNPASGEPLTATQVMCGKDCLEIFPVYKTVSGESENVYVGDEHIYLVKYSDSGDGELSKFAITEHPGSTSEPNEIALENGTIWVDEYLPYSPGYVEQITKLAAKEEVDLLDITGDGVVDFADFLKLAANYGKPDPVFEDGDLDQDGVVGFSDFLMLQDAFTNPILVLKQNSYTGFKFRLCVNCEKETVDYDMTFCDKTWAKATDGELEYYTFNEGTGHEYAANVVWLQGGQLFTDPLNEVTEPGQESETHLVGFVIGRVPRRHEIIPIEFTNEEKEERLIDPLDIGPLKCQRDFPPLQCDVRFGIPNRDGEVFQFDLPVKGANVIGSGGFPMDDLFFKSDEPGHPCNIPVSSFGFPQIVCENGFLFVTILFSLIVITPSQTVSIASVAYTSGPLADCEGQTVLKRDGGSRHQEAFRECLNPMLFEPELVINFI